MTPTIMKKAALQSVLHRTKLPLGLKCINWLLSRGALKMFSTSYLSLPQSCPIHKHVCVFTTLVVQFQQTLVSVVEKYSVKKKQLYLNPRFYASDKQGHT